MEPQPGVRYFPVDRYLGAAALLLGIIVALIGHASAAAAAERRRRSPAYASVLEARLIDLGGIADTALGEIAEQRDRIRVLEKALDTYVTDRWAPFAEDELSELSIAVDHRLAEAEAGNAYVWEDLARRFDRELCERLGQEPRPESEPPEAPEPSAVDEPDEPETRTERTSGPDDDANGAADADLTASEDPPKGEAGGSESGP